MAMSIKGGSHGARLGPVPGVVVLFLVVQEFFSSKGIDVEISSGREGEHIPGSIHLVDMAFDFKPKAVSIAKIREYAKELKRRLADDYDVVVNVNQKIIHIEYQPKKPLGKF